MADGTVTSPDGREWTISVRRVDWPKWRDSNYDPDYFDFGLNILGLLVAPIFWFVIPLVLLVLESPIAIVRSFGSDRRWIDARCTWPAEIVITWETTRANAAPACDYVRAQLVNGYEDITPSGSRLTEMTTPPGVEDRDD